MKTVYRASSLCALVLLLGDAHGQSDTERLFWESVDCDDETQVKLYIEQYPDGAYLDEADDCLAGLEAAEKRDAEAGEDSDEAQQDEPTVEQVTTATPPLDLPLLPEGTELLSEREIRDHIVGSTISDQPGGLSEYYASGGSIESSHPSYFSGSDTWDIDGYKLCRQYLWKGGGCWLLSIKGQELSIFDSRTGKPRFKAILLEGNPKNL